MPLPPWIAELAPFLKGAVGWSAATFVYESLVKPSRSRRRLAHVLAQEVAHNLMLMVYQVEQFRLAPKELPSDLRLADGVYRSLVDRIGDLPYDLPGDLILFYERVVSINNLTRDLVDLGEKAETIKRDPDRHGGMPAWDLKQSQLDRTVAVYKQSFEAAVDQGNHLLRRLRIAETFMGRVGYVFRRKPRIDPRKARAEVEAHRRSLSPH